MNFNEYIPNGGWLKRNARAKRFRALKTAIVYIASVIVLAVIFIATLLIMTRLAI